MVNENEVVTIKLDDIIPNRFQPREYFDDEALNELAESIRLHGVIQPIIVRQVDNKYEIIAGERRYKASVLAGKTDIPALVKNKDDKESSIIAYIENSQRKNVSAIEEARTCERLLSSNDITQEQLAKQLGMSQSTLANKLRLLTLPVEIQDAVLQGDVSERHARTLLSVKDTKKQLELLEKIKENKMTVRELEGEIKAMDNNGMNAQGLYDLPGSDDYKINAPEEMDMSKYEINPASEVKQEDITTPPPLEVSQPLPQVAPVAEPVAETPAAPVAQEPVSSGEFLSFLNDFDDSKLASTFTMPKQETPTEAPVAPVAEPVTPIVTEQPVEMPPVVETQPVEQPVEAPTSIPSTAALDSFNNFLNGFDTTALTQEVKETKNNFDDFLKQYENKPTEPMATENSVSPVEEATPVAPVENVAPAPSTGNSFDDFLKKYEAPAIPTVPTQTIEVPVEEAAPVETPVTETPVAPASNDFNNFLNTADTSDIANKYLNPITDVVPKVEYVENQPNYVDASKPKTFDTVDEIIAALKETTDQVKQSKYKITTDEVNFDDIYKITITIDKRNFL